MALAHIATDSISRRPSDSWPPLHTPTFWRQKDRPPKWAEGPGPGTLPPIPPMRRKVLRSQELPAVRERGVEKCCSARERHVRRRGGAPRILQWRGCSCYSNVLRSYSNVLRSYSNVLRSTNNYTHAALMNPTTTLTRVVDGSLDNYTHGSCNTYTPHTCA